MGTASGAATPVLSVADLALRSGVSVRTIRYYQSRGLLGAPARRGRSAQYDESHLSRLRVIAALQEQGLRHHAIRQLLQHVPDSDQAGEWLGLGEAMARPWTEDRPVLLTQAELEQRLTAGAAGDPTGPAGPGPIDLTRRRLGTDNGLRALIEHGLVERRTDTVPVVYLVPSPGLLDVALEADRIGLDFKAAARLRDLIQSRLEALAGDLVTQFTEEVSVKRLAQGGPQDLAGLLGPLQPLTRRTVDLIFAHEMERAQGRLLAQALEEEKEEEETE